MRHNPEARCFECISPDRARTLGQILQRLGIVSIDTECGGGEEIIVEAGRSEGTLGRIDPQPVEIFESSSSELCPKDITPEHRANVAAFEQLRGNGAHASSVRLQQEAQDKRSPETPLITITETITTDQNLTFR